MADTKHTHQVIFGRKEAGCPRCFELQMGSPARKGWGTETRRFEAQAVSAIRAHNCRASGCTVVCTFGDF